MRSVVLILICLLLQVTVLSQSCLPEGIYFTTQAQIDNFQTNHPSCTEIEGDVVIGGEDIANLNGLSVLTSIGGGLVIRWNPALTNLTGLDNVTSIGGYLWIGYNPLTNLTGLEGLTSIGGEVFISNSSALTSLTGLDNVTSIGGYLKIFANYALTNLTGLESLSSIGGYLEISNNRESLTSLMGLDNLTSIGGTLDIGGNYALTSLTGLEGLTSIGESLLIVVNFALTSLEGLDNVTSIGGALEISYNIALTSLTGLDNIESSTIEHLYIYENHSLSTCAILSICKYIASPNGDMSIHSNSNGCNNHGQVEQNCAEIFCLPEGITFTTQAQIDSFQINYPECSKIYGNVTIAGSDITNLNGLNILTYIGGDLRFHNNDELTSLEGLDNVTSIGGGLYIFDNDGITNLIGLDNIDATSIDSLFIYDNLSLTECEIHSICSYLSIPSGISTIYNNSPGCNSRQEVEEACDTLSIGEIYFTDFLTVSPNPFTLTTTLTYTLDKPSSVTIAIFNPQGQLIEKIEQKQTKGKQRVQWNAEGLPAGMYYFRIQTGEMVGGGKMVKMD